MDGGVGVLEFTGFFQCSEAVREKSEVWGFGEGGRGYTLESFEVGVEGVVVR